LGAFCICHAERPVFFRERRFGNLRQKNGSWFSQSLAIAPQGLQGSHEYHEMHKKIRDIRVIRG
jgi:hypothetical protein